MESSSKMMMEKEEASCDECEGSSSSSMEAMIMIKKEEDDDMKDDEHDIEAGRKLPEQQGECRICQEEDIMDKLETPCRCNGTLKFAHRECVQRWIDERLSIICEICHEPYESGYTVLIPPPVQESQVEHVAIGIRDAHFTAELEAHRAHIAAAAEFIRMQRAQQTRNARAYSAGVACRVGAVICLAFLVAKDAYYLYQNGEENDLFTIFCVMLGFFIPCCVLAWFANLWKNEGDLEASEVSVVPPSSTR